MAAILALRAVSVALSRAGALAAIAILVLCVGIILTEIVLRTLFTMSTLVSTEYVAYGMAAMSFLALGECLDRGGLIRLAMIFSVLPDRLRRALECLVCLLTLGAIFVPLWYFGRSVVLNYRSGFTSGTISEMPLWIPEFGMWIGIAIFWLRLLSYGLLVAVGLEAVDLDKSTKMIGNE